ncbi:AlpA family transcriptional regulator [Klebsiella pneumoniae]|uniref:helix-turn-helix transcriptional regulator n=1 Tax=Klebsiella pneumoniae TaxID=573 RepID=UPI0020335AD8|nr:AlpA family transcriptional regulator [Klebsiella pneumoniae]MCM2140979.1 AlpA family transcriptional regulator [Klebsiella pneumoniae]
MIQTSKEKHPKLIRLPEVIRKTGFGRTWIYELIKAGRFPKQVKISERSIAFIESEIDAWIEKVIAESRCVSEYSYRK